VVQKVFAENTSHPPTNVPIVCAVQLKHLNILDRKSTDGDLSRDTSDLIRVRTLQGGHQRSANLLQTTLLKQRRVDDRHVRSRIQHQWAWAMAIDRDRKDDEWLGRVKECHADRLLWLSELRKR
jgi:hypothetical protein